MPRRETVVPEDMKDVHERFRYSPGVKSGPFCSWPANWGGTNT
ncbi:hypothetical protein F4559_003229 [Saccharothrix violaceirubra]|uniref:Uncharacterized protein n=1 Tax=Saccharothrix violaceirubra TaxID=413306 RepID=A0A7W7WW02_9PSEU|nr:hypothetical protein [Saccharothrix violaceirubra]